MHTRLMPINALIALVKGGDRWPTPMGDAGYDLCGFEVKLAPVAKREVVADAVLAHAATGAVVLVECKSGQNINPVQMEAYRLVTATNVFRQYGAPFRITSREILVVGLAEHEERLRIAFDAAGCDEPLLLVGEERASLDKPLGAIGPFNTPVPGRPPRIINIDDQSSDEELVLALMPHIVAAAARGRPVVQLDEILGSEIPWWPLYHREGGQKRLADKASGALNAVFRASMAKDFEIEPRRAPAFDVVRILRTPAANPARGVTQGWQRLQRQTEKALGRKSAKSKAAGQLDLFSAEALGLGAETPGEPQ